MNMQLIKDWLGDGIVVNEVNPCVFDDSTDPETE